MKNLKAYSGDATKEYEDAVKRKSASPAKKSLNRIEGYVCYAYHKYKDCFDTNSLGDIGETDYVVTNTAKKHLLDMYSYQSMIVRNIRANITNQQLRTIQSKCQNCTIDSVGTMDHIKPKEKFPIYAVNGYNLFPCCSKCNSYKLDCTSSESFLNLFLDTLPEIQYLFVDVYKESDIINFQFYLSNKDGLVDEMLYNKICSHYEKLHLLERMKDEANIYLSDFVESIKPYYKKFGKDIIIESTTEGVKEKRNGYGYNYWKCSLELALVGSVDFWEYVDNYCI